MNKLLKIRSQTPALYSATPTDSSTSQDNQIIQQALAILQSRLCQFGPAFTNPEHVKHYLTLKAAEQEREVFGCLWLTNQHSLITDEEMFYGTIDGAAVYPREVVKACIARNAAAVIFYHNHPSGVCEPSQADRNITDKLKNALSLVEVRVVDHFIMGVCRPTALPNTACCDFWDVSQT